MDNLLTLKEWYPLSLGQIKILLFRIHHFPGSQNLESQKNDTFYLDFSGRSLRKLLTPYSLLAFGPFS